MFPARYRLQQRPTTCKEKKHQNVLVPSTAVNERPFNGHSVVALLCLRPIIPILLISSNPESGNGFVVMATASRRPFFLRPAKSMQENPLN